MTTNAAYTKPCCIEGCNETRHVSPRTGKPYTRCQTHMQQQWAEKNARRGLINGYGGKRQSETPAECGVVKLVLVDTETRMASRWVDGVCVQEVALAWAAVDHELHTLATIEARYRFAVRRQQLIQMSEGG